MKNVHETSVCSYNMGEKLQHPTLTLIGGVTLTQEHLILTPVIKRQTYHFIRILVGLLLLSVVRPLWDVLIGDNILLFAISLLVVTIPVIERISDRLLMLSIRKRGKKKNCLMIPIYSIKSVDLGQRNKMRGKRYHYIHVSYDRERGSYNDVSFVIWSWSKAKIFKIFLKRTQEEWAEAIREAIHK